MPGARYAALLRGINVGGHKVAMATLRDEFAALGFNDVTTVVNSGNVVCTSTSKAKAASLETRIERHLREVLGYDVATFLRTDREIAELAALEPFAGAPRTEDDRHHVLFLKTKPTTAAQKAVVALSTGDDVVEVHGREVHWLRRGTLMDSTIPDKAWTGALGKQPTTMRTAGTVRRLLAKL